MSFIFFPQIHNLIYMAWIFTVVTPSPYVAYGIWLAVLISYDSGGIGASVTGKYSPYSEC